MTFWKRIKKLFKRGHGSKSRLIPMRHSDHKPDMSQDLYYDPSNETVTVSRPGVYHVGDAIVVVEGVAQFKFDGMSVTRRF